MEEVKLLFNLKQPCDQCPFVKDTDMGKSLSTTRMTDIIQDLLSNDRKTFACHKTINYGVDEPARKHDKEQLCYGSMIYLQKIGHPHISQRLAYSMNILDYNKIVEDANLVIDPMPIVKKGKGK
jgi:hypothetical protein